MINPSLACWGLFYPNMAASLLDQTSYLIPMVNPMELYRTAIKGNHVDPRGSDG